MNFQKMKNKKKREIGRNTNSSIDKNQKAIGKKECDGFKSYQLLPLSAEPIHRR